MGSKEDDIGRMEFMVNGVFYGKHCMVVNMIISRKRKEREGVRLICILLGVLSAWMAC